MITVTVDDSAFRAYLAKLQGRLGNLTGVMDSIGNTFETNVRNRFDTRTDPNGKPWAPWKPSTADSYPKAGKQTIEGPGHGRLLDRYGTMLDSLSYTANSSSVRIGFGQAYAAYHEYGTASMERRGMLTADPESGKLGATDEKMVLELLEGWLLNLPA